jgi:hypothetical protein
MTDQRRLTEFADDLGAAMERLRLHDARCPDGGGAACRCSAAEKEARAVDP